MTTAERLLGKLPPYKDQWVIVKEEHKVKDIIKQVLNAHDQYAGHYDKIALSFDAKTIEQVCENLVRFCKEEIRYKEEGEKDQTTAIPTGILTRRQGDCKHYAGFCGGVLDSLNRLTNKKINWCYRFASYHWLNKTPHHVFIVVKDGETELWLDPVPGSDTITPVWQVDKKIKSSVMPLYNNIGWVPGPESGYYSADAAANVGFIDPEIVYAVGEQVVNFIKKFSDKVPNYPIKSKNTLNSLTASVNLLLPLPPVNVADAKRLLAIGIQQRAMSVARGNDVATQTAIMMWDERISALQNYIASGGAAFNLPPAGSVPTTQTGPIMQTQTQPGTMTAGMFSNPLLLVGLGGAAIYMLTRKKTAVRGTDMTTPILLGVGALLLLKTLNKPAPAVAAGLGSYSSYYDC